MEKWIDYIVEKIDNGEKLTDDELRDLVYEYDVDNIKEDDGRWYRSMTTICKLNDRLFSINWNKGLTENQDDMFNDQPVEVKQVTVEKLVTITTYDKLN